MKKFGELNSRDLVGIDKTNSEATKIEQSRAFGEVLIQAELAKKFPRNLVVVFKRIDEAFELSPELVAGAKYEYRKGQLITGYTVLFARTVAACVGNIHYSLKELNREADRTEMYCYAWDIETNAMQTKSFIVTHIQYAASNPNILTKERDIYENNTNVGSRRLRECILDVLPGVAVKYAERKVEELLKKAFPFEKQKAYADKNIERFGTIGVTEAMLIKNRCDMPKEAWTKQDFASLAIIWSEIEKRAKIVADYFEIPAKSIDIKKEVKKEQAKAAARLQEDAGMGPNSKDIPDFMKGTVGQNE